MNKTKPLVSVTELITYLKSQGSATTFIDAKKFFLKNDKVLMPDIFQVGSNLAHRAVAPPSKTPQKGQVPVLGTLRSRAPLASLAKKDTSVLRPSEQISAFLRKNPDATLEEVQSNFSFSISKDAYNRAQYSIGGVTPFQKELFALLVEVGRDFLLKGKRKYTREILSNLEYLQQSYGWSGKGLRSFQTIFNSDLYTELVEGFIESKGTQRDITVPLLRKARRDSSLPPKILGSDSSMWNKTCISLGKRDKVLITTQEDGTLLVEIYRLHGTRKSRLSKITKEGLADA